MPIAADVHTKRIVAIDVGSVRIGVAVSDPMGTFAQGVAVLSAAAAWVDELAEIVAEYGAGVILIGMPVRTDGTYGPEAEGMKLVEARLAKRFADIEVRTWDERFTTTIANRALLEADVSRRGRKGQVDKIAASLLLQSYLDSIRFAAAPDDGERAQLPPIIDRRQVKHKRNKNHRRNAYD